MWHLYSPPMRAGDTTATRVPGRRTEPAREAPPQAPRSRAERVVSRLSALNPGLIGIFVASFAFTAYYTSKVNQWVVMSDELQYAKLSLHIGETLSPIPIVRDQYTGSLAQLYPILTAPFYALMDMPAAFDAVHVANAAIMASTAFPAYLLCRELVQSRAAAYLVAALTVFVPWMALGTMGLTEVVAYPAFAWAVLSLQRSIAAPSRGRDALAVAGIGLAFLARTQFLLLAAVYPVAILLHSIGFAATRGLGLRESVRTGVREAVDRHRELAWLVGAAGVVVVLLAVSGSLGRVLGRYETTIREGPLLPDGIARSMAAHIAFIAVGTGVLPFVLAAAWAFGSLARPSSRPAHAFAVLSILTIATITFQSSSFNLRFALGGPIQDRYLFYIVPLLFVGMAACLLDARRRWLAVLAAGGVLAWFASLATFAPAGLPFFASPDSLFHSVIDGRAYSLGRKLGFDDLSGTSLVVAGSIAVTVATAVILRRLRPPVALAVVGIPVLLFCAVETRYVLGKITDAIGQSPAATELELTAEGRDWIDRVLPDGAVVGTLPAPVNSNTRGRPEWYRAGTPEAIFINAEFWNKSVRRAYTYEGYGDYAPFRKDPVSLDFATGRLDVPAPTGYWLVSASDPRLRPAGDLVFRSLRGLDVVRPSRPYRAAWATRGLAPDGWTAGGQPTRLRLYPEPGSQPVRRSVRIIFQSSADIPRTRAYRISTGGRSIAGEVRRARRSIERFSVCAPPGRPTDVRIDIPRATRLSEGRDVGMRITRLQVSARGTC
jgi:hypothetical protein